MANENNDDPFAPPPDLTLRRPSPGGNRRSPAMPAAPIVPSSGQFPTGAEPQPIVSFDKASAASLDEFLTTGLNPLVQAATPLLVLAGRLRGQVSQADVDALRRQSIQEMRAFEDRARRAGIAPEDILAARYALCTAVDEAVMNTPWGANSGWSTQSLLVTFHREVFGGAKFFDILDRVSNQSQRFLSLLELLYVCLALGFEGKYRLEERGRDKLAEIRLDLYRRIQALRGAGEADLSAHWKGVEDRRNAVLRFVPLWVAAAFSAVILFGGYILFSRNLSARAEPVNSTLAQMGLDARDLTAADAATNLAPTPSNGLKQALNDSIAQGLIAPGLLEVDEVGDRTRVTLTGGDLFSSGSAQVNPHFAAVLRQIGAALERLPGRITVIGHTDNRPIRSFEFTDNYELSRARAQHVADILKVKLTNPARLDASGVASSKPRFLPENDPANQARNRRVEILYRREG